MAVLLTPSWESLLACGQGFVLPKLLGSGQRLALSQGAACLGSSLGAEEREGPCAGDGASPIAALPSCVPPMHLLLAASTITYPPQGRGGVL